MSEVVFFKQLFGGIIGIILVVWGIIMVLRPYETFFWGRRWQFKYAEPSDEALRMMRLGGVLYIVLGIGVFVWLIFGLRE